MQEYVSGIQQIGIGSTNALTSLHYYAKMFGMNALVFNDVSEANLMTRYTGGNVYKRQAFLSLNMQGGGGFELWQFINRTPLKAETVIRYGDLGIYAAKIKCADLKKAFDYFRNQQSLAVSEVEKNSKSKNHFWISDKDNNLFNIVESNDWFQHNKNITGGVCGAVIGVSDMDNSLAFYTWLLQIDEPVYDEVICQQFPFENEKQQYRKVVLQKQATGKGAFGKLLGGIEIELVQCLSRKASKIYENRYWGDCGFIHLCFDVMNMCGLKNDAETNGYAFTVDSIDSFEMEKASGRFCYIEDPDGTLIELVETHKIPIIKKIGWYLNLKKRSREKPLPFWMIKLLALNKIK